MVSEFDPDDGVLRLRHGTLSVLARLAVAPTDPSLHDHDVAPLVAELRGLGILTPAGIHPAVAPLAEAVGSADRTFLLEAHDHGQGRRFRGWVGSTLAVIAAQVLGTDEHELMADTPVMLPTLVAELVGLGTAPEPPVAGERVVDTEALAAVVSRGLAATPEDVAALLGEGGEWAEALTDAVRGAAVRWRLSARDTWLEVLDAGRSGLWLLEPATGARTRVGATTPATVQTRLQAVL